MHICPRQLRYQLLGVEKSFPVNMLQESDTLSLGAVIASPIQPTSPVSILRVPSDRSLQAAWGQVSDLCSTRACSASAHMLGPQSSDPVSGVHMGTGCQRLKWGRPGVSSQWWCPISDHSSQTSHTCVCWHIRVLSVAKTSQVSCMYIPTMYSSWTSIYAKLELHHYFQVLYKEPFARIEMYLLWTSNFNIAFINKWKVTMSCHCCEILELKNIMFIVHPLCVLNFSYTVIIKNLKKLP